MKKPVDIFLEVGKQKTFAGAVEWPGWCRSGKGEQAAIQALLQYGARYALAMNYARLDFIPPVEITEYNVVERVPGNFVTDFGAPNLPIPSDEVPIDAVELVRFQEILKASWRAFDHAVDQARGRELRKGPRGGGRELQAIIDHVLGAELEYVRRLGQKINEIDGEPAAERLDRIRNGILHAFKDAVNGEWTEVGLHASKRWRPRYFVRRAAWHVLDHAWEIEDRII